MSTYVAEEQAHEMPVELFTFTIDTNIYRFTDAEFEFVHPTTSDVFTPDSITRSAPKQSGEDSSMTIEVTLDDSNPVSEFFRTPFLPSRKVWLTIERTHEGSVGDPAVIFRGQVGQCAFTGAHVVLTCLPINQVMTRSIPVQLVQILCTNTLYDNRCLLNPADFEVDLTVNAVNGIELTMVGITQPDGFFSGGYIQLDGKPAATIRDHTGNVFTLLYNPGYEVGDNVQAFPGCDGRYDTCLNKFNNVPNHQGFPFFPQIDPFTESVI